ncbi:MAG: threonine--tRNA ligase [Patescibacteria group bacterium]
MEKDLQEIMNHSATHIMMQALSRLYGAIPGVGPAIENGFYHDFEAEHQITEKDLADVEAEMKKIIKENLKIERKMAPIDEAIKSLNHRGYKYTAELAEELKKEGEKEVSFYEQGEFANMCRGPHLESTGKLGAFKLLSLAGAYWRGDEKNKMLQRIYGVAFETKEELDEYLKMQEEAEKRDHRKLGSALDIYAYDDDVGPGLPLFLPYGGAMIEELEKLAKEEEFQAGYVRVKTPHICKESMYLRSGHLPYYEESMFPPMEVDGTKYYLKPMNCPHHHKIFASRPKSYRDMPLRLAEYGSCYRYEQSGELFGLMRVRSMQMNDAHIYCTPEQFEEEFIAVCKMYLKYFKIFGIEKYVMRLSTHSKEGLGKKYVDSPELWKKTEAMVEKAMKDNKIEYTKVENEAAFYGPKIDVQIWSVIGKEFTLATNQVDFAVPERFGLTYKNAKGEDETPLCIHRAPLSTHERFIGFLIEHYAGAFPTWLSPVQAVIIPVSEKFNGYGEKVKKMLFEKNIRVEINDGNDSLGKRIRNAEKMKVPYILVVGEKELESETVAVRKRSEGDLGSKKITDFIIEIEKEIKDRK